MALTTEPPLETVVAAVTALHSPTSPNEEKTAASTYLEELQKSIFAWQTADSILSRSDLSTECYFFAAQTMRSKIQLHFYELPEDSHESLCTTLLAHASRLTATSPSTVTRQLSIAVADLMLQMTAWHNALADLLSRYSASPDHRAFLMSLLIVLPEEISSKSLRLGANRRKECVQELRQSQTELLKFLSSQQDRVSAFKCLSCWLQIHAVSQESGGLKGPLVSSGLLEHLLKVLRDGSANSNMHGAASDCMCSALQALDEIDKERVLTPLLQREILSLANVYMNCVAQEDLDKCHNYAVLFSELGEASLEFLLEDPLQPPTMNGVGYDTFTAPALLELLLVVVSHYDGDIAETTFNFWFTLAESLYPEQGGMVRVARFRPWIERLILALCKQVQLESDQSGVPDNSSDEFVFRERIYELVVELVAVVGATHLFGQLFSLLRDEKNPSWEVVESLLFLMSAAAPSVVKDESTIVPLALDAILALPPSTHHDVVGVATHPAVLATALRLISYLADWVDQHPVYLDGVLQFILRSFHDHSLSSAAALCLEEVSLRNRHRMIEHFSGLVQIIEQAEKIHINQNAILGLVKGAAIVLSLMPHAEITPNLRALAGYQVNPLKHIITDQQNKATEPKSAKEAKLNPHTDPATYLDRLAALFRYTSVAKVAPEETHPCQAVVAELWPVLDEVCQVWLMDERVIERATRAIRYTIRCLGQHTSHLLTAIASSLVSLYQRQPHSAFIYICSILVDEFGSHKDCVPGLMMLVCAIGQPALSLVERNGFQENPDTVDDLFRLFLRFVQTAPDVFLGSEIATPAIQCAIAACSSFSHREGLVSVLKFLQDTVYCAQQQDLPVQPLAASLVRELAQPMVAGLLSGVAQVLPSNVLLEVADLLNELRTANRELYTSCLIAAMTELPRQRPGGAVCLTDEQMNDFGEQFLTGDSTKKLHSSLKHLQKLYR